MEGDVCARCGRDLERLDEIHVVEGQHFCSKECAIEHQAEIIIASARDTAAEWYNDGAEIVTPVDIGIVYEKVWTTYSTEYDVTTIFKTRYLDKEMHEAIATEVVGFYWGEPDEKETETFTGQLKAEY